MWMHVLAAKIDFGRRLHFSRWNTPRIHATNTGLAEIQVFLGDHTKVSMLTCYSRRARALSLPGPPAKVATPETFIGHVRSTCNLIFTLGTQNKLPAGTFDHE